MTVETETQPASTPLVVKEKSSGWKTVGSSRRFRLFAVPGLISFGLSAAVAFAASGEVHQGDLSSMMQVGPTSISLATFPLLASFLYMVGVAEVESAHVAREGAQEQP